MPPLRWKSITVARSGALRSGAIRRCSLGRPGKLWPHTTGTMWPSTWRIFLAHTRTRGAESSSSDVRPFLCEPKSRTVTTRLSTRAGRPTSSASGRSNGYGIEPRTLKSQIGLKSLLLSATLNKSCRSVLSDPSREKLLSVRSILRRYSHGD